MHVQEPVNGTCTIINHRTGHIHQLNATASTIWQLCDGSMTKDSIAEHLAHHYSIEAHQALSDVTIIVDELHKLGLLDHAHE